MLDLLTSIYCIELSLYFLRVSRMAIKPPLLRTYTTPPHSTQASALHDVMIMAIMISLWMMIEK